MYLLDGLNSLWAEGPTESRPARRHFSSTFFWQKKPNRGSARAAGIREIRFHKWLKSRHNCRIARNPDAPSILVGPPFPIPHCTAAPRGTGTMAFVCFFQGCCLNTVSRYFLVDAAWAYIYVVHRCSAGASRSLHSYILFYSLGVALSPPSGAPLSKYSRTALTRIRASRWTI
jgi:hypothetical protein